MADNRQTIAQIPHDLTDPTSQRRFLSTLIENLDTVLGYRGDTKYVTDEDLEQQGVNLTNLSGRLQQLTSTLAELRSTVSENEDRLATAEGELDQLDFAVETQQLGSSYYNFNAAGWSELKGKGELTAVGANITNAPVTPGATDNVRVFVDSTKTSNSVWQIVWIDFGSNRSMWSRVGVNSNWIQLG